MLSKIRVPENDFLLKIEVNSPRIPKQRNEEEKRFGGKSSTRLLFSLSVVILVPQTCSLGSPQLKQDEMGVKKVVGAFETCDEFLTSVIALTLNLTCDPCTRKQESIPE